jgi:hypothetical protein
MAYTSMGFPSTITALEVSLLISVPLEQFVDAAMNPRKMGSRVLLEHGVERTGYKVPPTTRPRGYHVRSSNQFHML